MTGPHAQPLALTHARRLLRAIGLEQYAVMAYRTVVPLPLRLGLRERAFARTHGSAGACGIDVGGRAIRFGAEDSYSRQWLAPYSGGRLHEQPVTLLLLEEMVAGHHMTGGDVHAFEMDASNFRLLEQNVALNGLNRVRIVHAAVSDSPGTLVYQKTAIGPGANISIAPTSGTADGTTRVPAVSLDDYFEQFSTTPDLLKIDVEGAELRVLNGMRRLIHDHKPRLLLEVHPANLRSLGSSAREVLQLLAAAGYEIRRVHGVRDLEGGVRLEEVDLTTPPMQNTTYFAS